jgi:prophage regulatory protein
MAAFRNRSENSLVLGDRVQRSKPADNGMVETERSPSSNVSAGTRPVRLLRIKDVIQIAGLSRMTIYRLERAGNFPRRRRLGVHSVAWLESDVSHWVETRPAALQKPEVAGGYVALRRTPDHTRP